MATPASTTEAAGKPSSLRSARLGFLLLAHAWMSLVASDAEPSTIYQQLLDDPTWLTSTAHAGLPASLPAVRRSVLELASADLQNRPDDAAVALVRGRLLGERDPADAEQLFIDYAERHPADARIPLLRGLTLLVDEREHDAIEALRQAEELRPVGAVLVRCLALRGLAEDRAGWTGQALASWARLDSMRELDDPATQRALQQAPAQRGLAHRGEDAAKAAKGSALTDPTIKDIGGRVTDGPGGDR